MELTNEENVKNVNYFGLGIILLTIIFIKICNIINNKINDQLIINNKNILDINTSLRNLNNNLKIIEEILITLKKSIDENESNNQHTNNNHYFRDMIEENALFCNDLLGELQKK